MGHLSNGEHALIPVEPGDLVIHTNHHCRDHILSVSVIEKMTLRGTAEALEVFTGRAMLDDDRLVVEPHPDSCQLPDTWYEACIAVLRKAETYHCREAVYVA